MPDALEEMVAKIPTETRWAIAAARGLTGAFRGLASMLRHILGQEKAVEITQEITKNGGKSWLKHLCY